VVKTKIGIRREDKNQWERRVPLIPVHVGTLINKQTNTILKYGFSLRASVFFLIVIMICREQKSRKTFLLAL